jgi:hypothetical protein
MLRAADFSARPTLFFDALNFAVILFGTKRSPQRLESHLFRRLQKEPSKYTRGVLSCRQARQLRVPALFEERSQKCDGTPLGSW